MGENGQAPSFVLEGDRKKKKREKNAPMVLHTLLHAYCRLQIQSPAGAAGGLETSHPAVTSPGAPVVRSLPTREGAPLAHQGPCQIPKLPLPILKLRNKHAVKS